MTNMDDIQFPGYNVKKKKGGKLMDDIAKDVYKA